LQRRRGDRRPDLRGVRATLACAALIAPTMGRVVAEFNALTGAAIRVKTVPNRYFGPEISVSGLLTGADVLQALREEPGDGPVLLTRVMFSRLNGLTLDNLSIEQPAAVLSTPYHAALDLIDEGR